MVVNREGSRLLDLVVQIELVEIHHHGSEELENILLLSA